MSIPLVGDRPVTFRPPPGSGASPQGRPAALSAPASTLSSDPPSSFARLVRGLGHEVQRSETLVHQAIASASGGQLGAAELIALQAGVYRYSEAVDLASRLIDHATSALKTVIQGQ